MEQCKVHARYFTRTFHPGGGDRGEKEENSAWFDAAPADSHFVMGCTLRFNRTLSFLGLYYTAEPPAIAQANTAPITGIGFDGTVVLSINGRPVTFVPVQPFDTAKVKTRWSDSPTVSRNCQSPRGTDGGYHFMTENIYADLSHFDRDGIAEVGLFPELTHSREYIEIFKSALPREIVYAWHTEVLVTASGSILVDRASFPKTCHEGVPQAVANSSLLLLQLCRLYQVK